MNQIRYILDTDIVTYHQYGDQRVIEQLRGLPATAVATTVVSMYEQLRGRLAAVNQQQLPLAQQQAFERLQKTHRYYCLIPVLSFDEAASEHFERLRREKMKVKTQDLRIAAITLAHGAVLVTRNRRDFNQISHLQIESWL